MAPADPHRDLLERATAAIERMDQRAVLQQASLDRQAEAFDRQERTLEQLIDQMRKDRAAAQAREER